MRLYPPSRPARYRLSQPLTLPPVAPSAAAIDLPAGCVVAPEPFVAHFAVTTPNAFSPQRFLASDKAEPPPPLVPFGSASAGASSGGVGCLGGGAEGAAGARLAVSMAKAVYVQVRRMFDETIIGASPPAQISGCPVCTISERVEVLCKPKMYYELQRGVKKLRF